MSHNVSVTETTTTVAVVEDVTTVSVTSSSASYEISITNGGAFTAALNDLSDVDTTGVLDNYVLSYNSATTSWDVAAQTGGLGVSDGDKGDITVSASGATWTVDNDVVTYAKMQNVSATSRFLGRITAAAGDIEELTGTQATTLLDNFTSGLKGLTPLSGGGTSNFLRADGTWATPPSGSVGIVRSVSSISSPTTAGATAATDYVYLVSGTTTLTLPTAVGNSNLYTVKNTGVNTVTIATTSSQTIDGSTTASLPVANTSLCIISNGTNWAVV